MNTKVISVVLAVAVVALGITLYVVKNQDDQRHAEDVTAYGTLSNQLASTSMALDDAKQANLSLTNNLLTAWQQKADLSNAIIGVQQQLADQKHTTEGVRTELASAQDHISGLNKRVTELEADNNALDRRAAELTNAINTLNSQITDLQGQLATTRNDKSYLEQQLAQLRAQKAELERRFNDLAIVRDQYRKLKTESFITNHIRLERENPNAFKKGAQVLKETRPANSSAPAHPASSSHYDLNVEVNSDGSVHVLPPPTNSPAR